MTFSKWIEYAVLNLSAASAIALDACLLVIIKFRDFSKPTDALKWAGAVGLTHVLFPMFGFVGGWLIINRYPAAASVIYGLGAILLGILIYVVVLEAIEPESNLSHAVAVSTSFYTFWVPVLYVSLDALLSGLGKTVLIARYPKQLAVLSFVIVGSLVAFFTLLAGLISRHLHERWISQNSPTAVGIARATTIGVIGEIILFSFFLIWCVADLIINLPDNLHRDIPFLFILFTGLTLGTVVSLLFFKRIRLSQLSKIRSLLNP
jgi:hypothetical protein